MEQQNPDAWVDLKKAIELFHSRADDLISPFHCEHDTLYVSVDPGSFTSAELEQLAEWGFLPGADEPMFYSFRFGSA